MRSLNRDHTKTDPDHSTNPRIKNQNSPQILKKKIVVIEKKKKIEIRLYHARQNASRANRFEMVRINWRCLNPRDLIGSWNPLMVGVIGRGITWTRSIWGREGFGIAHRDLLEFVSSLKREEEGFTNSSPWWLVPSLRATSDLFRLEHGGPAVQGAH